MEWPCVGSGASLPEFTSRLRHPLVQLGKSFNNSVLQFPPLKMGIIPVLASWSGWEDGMSHDVVAGLAQCLIHSKCPRKVSYYYYFIHLLSYLPDPFIMSSFSSTHSFTQDTFTEHLPWTRQCVSHRSCNS